MISPDDFKAVSTAELPPAPAPKRKRRACGNQPFLRGPIPMRWLARVQCLAKPAMGVALALWFQTGVRSRGGPVKVTSAVRRHMGLSNDQAQRGVRALAAAGLVRVICGGRGRCAVVEIASSEHWQDGKQEGRDR